MTKKILSLLAAALWVWTIRSHGPSTDERWWIPFAIVLLPLSFIWFSDLIAPFSTTKAGGWRQPTSPEVIAFIGWLCLLVPPVLVATKYAIIHWP